MKPLIAILVLVAMTPARAQQPAKPLPPPKPVPPAQSLPPIEPAQVAPREVGDIEKSAQDIVRRSIRFSQDVAAGAVGIAASAAPAVPGAPAVPPAIQVELQDLHANLYGGAGTSRGNRSLVIQSTEPDAVANANTEEDLAIMSRILRKAVGNSQDEGRRVVLGTEVSVFGSASGARNIYLDGYGALFLVSVRYPLIAPEERREEVKAKDNISDEWKAAQEEERQSRPGGGYGSASGGFAQNWTWSSSRSQAEDFDSDKVDKLKTSLFESLKNATHIRILKPNDFVTIVVQGAEAVRIESAKRKTSPTATVAGKPGPADSDLKDGKAGNSPSKSKSSRIRTSLGETVMTIRVKKSDVDAFAQGKLDVDAFQKKASLQTYFRRTDSTSASAFVPVAR